MKLTQIAPSKAHHILLFGPPKSGKTELVGKLAERFNLLYFDLEAGITTLLKLPEDWKERIDVISLPDTHSFPIAIETMLKVIKGGPHDICERHGKVSCALCKKDNSPVTHIELNAISFNTIVVIDSLTQLTNSAIAHITRGTDDLYKMQIDDWGNLGKLLDIFLSHVQQAPFHIVCITHEAEVDMVDGKPKIVPTVGTRNYSRNTAKYFDEVIYCEVKNKEHRAGSSTKYANNILTGSRTGYLLDQDKTPSLIPIFTGERPTINPMTAGSPAQTSINALEKLQASLKKG